MFGLSPWASGAPAALANGGGQDQIDLHGIAFGAQTTLGYSQANANTGGMLMASNGTYNANLALLANYAASQFIAAGDDHSGTLIANEASPLSEQLSLRINPTQSHA